MFLQLYYNKEPCVFPCQEGWHRPTISFLSSFSFIIKSRTPQADPTAAGCGFYTLRCRARPGTHKTKIFSQKGLTFCPAYGIILEQSARTAEERKVNIAGWSSLVARRAHNPKVVGSNPAPATTKQIEFVEFNLLFCAFTAKRERPLLRIVQCEQCATLL